MSSIRHVDILAEHALLCTLQECILVYLRLGLGFCLRSLVSYEYLVARRALAILPDVVGADFLLDVDCFDVEGCAAVESCADVESCAVDVDVEVCALALANSSL